MPTLQNWAVVMTLGPYDAPEAAVARLTGEVFGHPRFSDGTVVQTSRIVSLSTKERKATTKSGTSYDLGEPSADFLRWLEQNGHSLDAYKVNVEAETP